MELNPNHPITRMAHDSWHKVAAILMLKSNQTAVEITETDIAMLGDNEKAVVADCRGGKFVIRVIGMAEATALAREEGGLPV